MNTASGTVSGSTGTTPEGIIVNAPADLTTSEAGKSVTIGYQLQTQPTGPVKLLFVLSDTAQGEASLSTASLSFTTTNWNQPQPLTITGLDDAVVDGDKAYSLTTRISTGDSKYASLSVAPINLSNLDDDLEEAGTDIYGDSGAKPTKDLLRGTKGPDRIYGKDADDGVQALD